MGLWIVQGATLKPVRKIDNAVLLHPDNRDSVDTQEMLRTMHHNKHWLLCGCKKPDARMFVRAISPDRFVLVNHHEFGIHDPHCPLMTIMAGASGDRQEPDALDGGSGQAKQSEYRLLTPYRKSDLLEITGGQLVGDDDMIPADVAAEKAVNEKSTSEARNPADKIDLLFRLLWQLIDDSFCAYQHPQQTSSPIAMETKLRAATDTLTLKGFGGSMKDFTFTGMRGLDFLFSKLRRAQKQSAHIRHQFLYLCVVSNVSHNAAGVSVTLPDGSAMVLGVAKRPALVLNKMGEGEGPFILVAVYGFAKPSDDHPMILKWALQPLASIQVPLPVASWPERLIMLEMARNLEAHDPSVNTRYKLWLHKPVLPMQDKMTGVWVQPVASLMAKDVNGERCRVAYRLSGEVDNIDAYRRTFEHVHTLDLNTPDMLAKSCTEMFLMGKGVIEQHYRKMEKESAEHEQLLAGRQVQARMVEREQEILTGQGSHHSTPADPDHVDTQLVNDELGVHDVQGPPDWASEMLPVDDGVPPWGDDEAHGMP
jgi:hypothetical protein